MDRTEKITEPQSEPNEILSFGIESGLYSPSSRDSSRSLFGPLHYEPKYAYPLLVWLHAPGYCDENQLLRIMPIISMRNYVAVAPRGFPDNEEEADPNTICWPQSVDHIQEAECRVIDSIEAASRKYHVNRDRIFLAGFDAGGTMAFRIAMNRPGRFAGVASLCGGFPRGNQPFHRLSVARHLPVFLSVGRDSRIFSPDRACDDLRLFHTAGVHVTLRQYPCPQQLSPQMLRDLDRWIIDQVTGG